MIIKQIFSTPFWIKKNIELDYDAIIKRVYSIRAVSAGRALTNYGGWQSENINELSDYKEFVEIKELFQTSLKEIASSIHEQCSFEIQNSWININKKGNFNLKHYHPISSLSGVLYLKTDSDSGDFSFTNDSIMQHYPIHSYMSTNTMFLTHHTIKPETGMLIIFPAWTQHEVSVSKSDYDRISLAFNCIESC
jgi:uncharacterized protein (TIGR02466 family)